MPRQKISEETERTIYELREQGLKYREIAEQTKVSKPTICAYVKARELGMSLTEYREHQAQQRGFESSTEYNEKIGTKRIQTRDHVRMAFAIQNRLEDIGKTPSWLAKQLGVSRQNTNNWFHGFSTPKNGSREELLAILKIQEYEL